MKIVTATQMAELDRKTIEQAGVAGETLMERAGHGIFKYARKFIERRSLNRKVVLFAGKGNNGGDAFVVARLLHESRIDCCTFALTNPDLLGGDAAGAYQKLVNSGGRVIVAEHMAALAEHEALLAECGLIVDGILGTGIRGEAEGFFAEAIEYINRKGKPVISIDIPSGISGDEGIKYGACINATATVTMAQPKRGCFLGNALNFLGRLAVVDIGIPADFVEAVESNSHLLTQDEMARLVPERERISHKGTYGRMLVLAGSPGYTGAAAMTCLGALRVGAGLVYLGIPKSLNPILETKLTETITIPLEETPDGRLSTMNLKRITGLADTMDAVIIGPGIGTSPDTAVLVRKLLDSLHNPLVLDADGLNCLGDDAACLDNHSMPIVVTPHPGEMARLTGASAAEIMNARWESALEFSRSHEVITVLKGAGTVIADPVSDQVSINITGNPGMASAGTGDVLTGMIGGFIAQGVEPAAAAKLGVYLHGLAGDIAAEQMGEHSLIAGDVIAAIPRAFKKLKRR